MQKTYKTRYTDAKAKQSKKDRLAYQIEEKEAEDGKVAAKSVFGSNRRTARAQREKMKNSKGEWFKGRMIVLWKQREKGRELFKNCEIRRRR